MSPKSIPFSVRLSEEDADFLSSFDCQGATTPSDKIRALVADARRLQSSRRSYAEGILFQESMTLPLIRTLRSAEHKADCHSEFLFSFLNWLPEIQAFLQTELSAGSEDTPEDSFDLGRLRTVEAGAARRIMEITETLLRLAVAQPEPCYDPTCISQRLGPILQLCNLLRANAGTTGHGAANPSVSPNPISKGEES